MNYRPACAHSQPRILRTLALAPMTKLQLEQCLMLDRRTVSDSLAMLELRGRVQRQVRGSAKYGAWPDLFSLKTSRGSK